MPGMQLDANVWFYQDFLSDRQGKEFWTNRPEDWSRLQVWDGNTLKPVMEQGFQGLPTPEQVRKLYDHAQQGQLFFFELGNATPRQLGVEEQNYLQLNPQEPVAPVKPNVAETDSLMVSYNYNMMVYQHEMEQYQKNLDTLANLGDNFKNALNAYNNSRDMQSETVEVQARNLNAEPEKKLRNREKADRVLDQVFGPKPVAAPDIFYKTGHRDKESVIKYEFFDQFQDNAYDVPQNSKLNASDIATINYAMLGAKEPVIQICQDKLGAGPLNAKFMATNDFQMLTTGLFGQARSNQQLIDNKVVGEVLKISKDAIDQYNKGKPDVLGKHLGECVRTVKDYFVSSSQNSFTQDLVAGTRLIERLEDLFKRKPDLLQAADLSDNEIEFMRGYSQMGKVYDNYLHAQIKMNNAAVRGTHLTTQEKAEILTDALIRRIVEKELTKDRQRIEATDEFKQNSQAADAKDEIVSENFLIWQNTELRKLPLEEQDAAQTQYLMQNDYNMNKAFAVSLPVDHSIIQKLAQPGMLENLRQRLQNDAVILAEAAKEPMQISHDKLFESSELDKLTDYAVVTNEQKQAWFNNTKALLGDQPWLNAKATHDATRLMIAVPNGEGGKRMERMADLVEGGVKALENPTRKALDLMYRNAMDGNLYFYNVGQNMPQRLTANGTEASAEQIKAPVEPTVWHWIANILTFGRAYRDILYPKPDRDPAAMDSILRSSDGRTAIITEEMNAHDQLRQAAEQARKANEDRIKEDVNNFRRIPDGNVPREFPQYDLDTVEEKLKDMVYVETLKVQDKLLAGEMSSSGVYILDRLCAKNPTQQQIREAMAAAVLLEAVKEERLAGTGDAVRTQLVRNRKGTVQSMVDNEIFQAFTQDASMDMLKHFLMTDGARNMYQAIKNISANRAKQQEQGKEANALEQNMQQQKENPIAGLS